MLVFYNLSKRIKNWKSQIVIGRRVSPLRRWGLPVNLCILLTISSCYGSISLTLGLIGRDGGLSTLYHSCGYACQQRVLKTFPGPGYLHSEDGGVLTMAFIGFSSIMKLQHSTYLIYDCIGQKSLFRINAIDAICGFYLFIFHFHYYFHSFFQFLHLFFTFILMK